MGDFVTVKWDLPIDVTEQLFLLLSARTLAVCSCVSKTWRDIIQENPFRGKLSLERAWRCGIVTPKRTAFGVPGEFDMACSAKWGTTIALGAYDEIALIDLANDAVLAKDCSGYGQCISFVNGVLLSTDGERSVRSWGIPKLNEIATFEIWFAVDAIVDVGGLIAIGGEGGSLGLWKIGESVCARVLRDGDVSLGGTFSKKDILCLAFCKDSCTLACGLRGGNLELWCLSSYVCMGVIEGLSQAVRYVDVNEHTIFSVSEFQFLHVWSRESKECVWVFEIGGVFFPSCAALCDRRFACVTRDGDVGVWDIEEACHLRTLHVEEDVVGVFLADTKITIVLFDGVVLEWDFTTLALA